MSSLFSSHINLIFDRINWIDRIEVIAQGSKEKETQDFTAELAENAEKKMLNNLCVLSELCGEIHYRCFPEQRPDF